ncbi:MAG: cytochrome C [Meiothermus sp.]
MIDPHRAYRVRRRTYDRRLAFCVWLSAIGYWLSTIDHRHSPHPHQRKTRPRELLLRRLLSVRELLHAAHYVVEKAGRGDFAPGVHRVGGLAAEGLDEGKEVSGDLNVTLRVADPDVKPTRDRFPGVAAVVATVLVLGGVWLFFAVTGATNKTLEEVAAKPSPQAEGGTQAAAPSGPAPAVDVALVKAGEGVFTTNCAGCHQASGTGVPGAFPPLAGNPHLADVKHVTSTIIKGLNVGVEVNGQKYTQPMPAFGQLSDKDVAAVASYIRNSWGNKFGGVTEADAKASR